MSIAMSGAASCDIDVGRDGLWRELGGDCGCCGTVCTRRGSDWYEKAGSFGSKAEKVAGSAYVS